MLSVEGLSKTYQNGVVALQDFHLEVHPGEIVAVIGGSGCGKSTLLRLISGLDQPTAGNIAINGEAVRAPHQLINLIFQEPRLLPWLTVGENIRFGLRHLERRERDERATAALDQVHLAGYENSLPKELSGGQAQRAAIARALVTKPEVLLLDEPFSALDALTRSALQNHLVGIWRQTHSTMIIVTHDIEEAVALAHRVIVMQPSPGRIMEEIAINLPMPREVSGQAVDRYKKKVRASLDRSLSKSGTGMPDAELISIVEDIA